MHIDALDFHPDGGTLATGRDGSIVLYDLTKGGAPRCLAPGAVPQALRFDPSGRRIAVVSLGPGEGVQVRLAGDGAVEATWSAPDAGILRGLAPRGPLAGRGAHRTAGSASSTRASRAGSCACSKATTARLSPWPSIPPAGCSPAPVGTGRCGSGTLCAGEELVNGPSRGPARSGSAGTVGSSARATMASRRGCGRWPRETSVARWPASRGGGPRRGRSGSSAGMACWSSCARRPAGAPEPRRDAGVPGDARDLERSRCPGRGLPDLERHGGRPCGRSDGLPCRRSGWGRQSPSGPLAGFPTGRIRLGRGGRTLAAVVDDEIRGHFRNLDLEGRTPLVVLAGHRNAERLALSPDGRLGSPRVPGKGPASRSGTSVAVRRPETCPLTAAPSWSSAPRPPAPDGVEPGIHRLGDGHVAATRPGPEEPIGRPAGRGGLQPRRPPARRRADADRGPAR